MHMWFPTSSLPTFSTSNPSQAHLIPPTRSSCSPHCCRLAATPPSGHISPQPCPLLASVWLSFMCFKTKALTVMMWQRSEHCLALTRFLTQSISCSVVQGLAFLSNFKLYHISPKCSSYIPSFLQLKTHHKFLQPKDLLLECNPPLFTQSLFAQLTSTGRQVSAQLSSPHGHLCWQPILGQTLLRHATENHVPSPIWVWNNTFLINFYLFCWSNV